ncbi:MAG: cytidine deaminase [Lachnospiraceae bacterium]|nr:cytidine deaminase [Lachnospiraceae bacterium]
MQDQELIKKAFEARQRAYVPYSHFSVGAALETEDGQIFLGCNIENASYTPTICAERTAFFKAVSEGNRSFRQIAIVGGYSKDAKGKASAGGSAPSRCFGEETMSDEGRKSAGASAAEVEMELDSFAPPCGVCRQVMAEFCDPENFRIILARSLQDYQSYTLKELLPLNFGPKDL